ncbi:MAG: SDR family oxidoreductase [Chlorobiaceae bacterium]|jgi:dihydroflavonol-4-reductase|nr:SDR family oxidoreductase [Chlorobiaceae bacterium]NTV16740.1 SDR family oxidoreductase [Chlorobiaceae bacterium]
MITTKPVCVTGASGFIAAHIIRDLLDRGYSVRGTVRKSPQSYPFLLGLSGAKERLELVQADLLTAGAYDRIIEGCEYVMHTASPYEINVKNPQTDLVDPAVNGTETVLESCQKSGSVKRIIFTSSIAAITDEPNSMKVFTEKDWNTMSSLERHPYHYSKTLAERAAWDFVMRKRQNFDLVVINPFMVIGPSLSPSLNTTNRMIRDIMSGVYPGIMDINWGFVDVRDVAKAHLLAMETDTASGRYLCSAETLHMKGLVALLKSSGFSTYALPKVDLSGKAGTILMKVLSYTQPRDTGMYIRTNIGRTFRYDNAKILHELGISFMPIKDSLTETVKDMIRWGHLPQSR